ncbi:hypothetical protein PENSPDRAFT_580804 [Peniophora sp. CONT]|nr:hypothetical protein PENSPDRAFT_580804 [Peniophora sp. CONT]
MCLAKSDDGATLIAVDMDDVLSQTTQCVADWHNINYGTNMDLSTFYYAMWYKCPGWGSVSDTLHKVKTFYAQDQLKDALPVEGAHAGLRSLTRLGYRPVIVTARIFRDEYSSTRNWLNSHFGSVFSTVIFSKQPEDCAIVDDETKCTYISSTKSKAEICSALNAVALIDDSLETALACNENAEFQVLLFGQYEWNKRRDQGGPWSFDEKAIEMDGQQWWKEEDVDISTLKRVSRARDWDEVLALASSFQ